jgi:hypothetical protein
MARSSKQIGWSQEANLYYELLKQLERLTAVMSKASVAPPATTTSTTTVPGSITGIVSDLFSGSDVANACAHTVSAPPMYLLLTPPAFIDVFVVGKRWYLDIGLTANYPSGTYSLYNPFNSLSGNWAKVLNGVVTEVGTCV